MSENKINFHLSLFINMMIIVLCHQINQKIIVIPPKIILISQKIIVIH